MSRQPRPPESPDSRNHGEGDPEAARRFNAAERAFVDSEKGRAAIAADKAPKTSTEEQELLDAEEEALKRARETDLDETRDYHKPAG